MADTREKIQALLDQHGARQIMAEYIKMRLRQRKNRGWEAVNNQLRKKIYFSKLKVQSLRQFIPQTERERTEELANFIDKNFFEYERAPQLEESTTSV